VNQVTTTMNTTTMNTGEIQMNATRTITLPPLRMSGSSDEMEPMIARAIHCETTWSNGPYVAWEVGAYRASDDAIVNPWPLATCEVHLPLVCGGDHDDFVRSVQDALNAHVGSLGIKLV
jgi:hypothetical protein